MQNSPETIPANAKSIEKPPPNPEIYLASSPTDATSRNIRVETEIQAELRAEKCISERLAAFLSHRRKINTELWRYLRTKRKRENK